MASTRVTRSANTTTFSWVYVGTGSKDMQSVQNGKCEDVLMYDMDIITPDGKVKKDRSFFFEKCRRWDGAWVLFAPRHQSQHESHGRSCNDGSRRTQKKNQKAS